MALRIENLSKAFGKKAVLNRFSLNLPDSGVVVLMGLSGCGKTTLLRLLAGLERPDDGKIFLPEDLRLSMVFQEDRLLEELTARGNLLAVLERGREESADLWLERMGIADAAGLFPREMSGGMRRRLANARAMAYGGNVTLLDEPFQGLDVRTREQLYHHMFDSGELSGLVVIITHDRQEALRVGRRLVVFDGPPLAVIEDLLL